jgi:ATP-dependent RNA helicase DeaD
VNQPNGVAGTKAANAPVNQPTNAETKPANVAETKAAPTQQRPPRQQTPQARPEVEAAADGAYYFGSLVVSYDMACALKSMGYENPSPVQEQCIPTMLKGTDVVAQAMTGTGKTAAFGIPMIERIDPDKQGVQGLVMAPTRELAVQVRDEIAKLSEFKKLRVVACYGGQTITTQITALERGAHIVVGTPGRLLDHLSRRTLSLANVNMVVLDEADEMLDIGFLPDIERILRQTPKARQTSLFSATMHATVRRIVHRHLQSPEWIQVGGEVETAPKVKQLYFEVWDKDKVKGLSGFLQTQLNGGKALLFRKTQIGVDRLVQSLQRDRISVEGIHGGMTQSQRSGTMKSFKEGKVKVLVATNVAARGLDIPEVSHVINYDMPQNMEEYIHRIGRTARMEADGTAITFVTEWDMEMLDMIIDKVGDDLQRGTLPLYE